jgi:HTH-type transcriptional regulator/antitoxin HigA
MSKKLEEFEDFEVGTPRKGRVAADDVLVRFKEFKVYLDRGGADRSLNSFLGDGANRLEVLQYMFRSFLSGELPQLYRKRDDANEVLGAAWSSKVFSEAYKVLSLHNVPQFSGLDSKYLASLARESVEPKNVISLPEKLREVGVVLVHARVPERAKIDGIVTLLETGHPVVGIGFRYPRLDYYWFTLLHELSHIVLHFDLLNEPILDDFEDVGRTTPIEAQANRLAKDSIVPRHLWRNSRVHYDKSSGAIIEFSKQIGVHPALIAGLLQREDNSYEKYRKIVDAVDLREVVFAGG